MRKQLDFNPMSAAFIKAREARPGGLTGSIEWIYENYRDRPYDKDSLSAREMANRAAELFYRHIRLGGRLKDGSRVNLEEVSHTPTLDMFVAEAFREQIEMDPVNPEGSSPFQKMGGGFKEAEQFQILAKTDENGRLSAQFLFRGKVYPVNLKKLRQMAEEWKNTSKF